MSPRPPSLLQQTHRASTHWICSSCLRVSRAQTALRNRRFPLPRSSSFHASAYRRSDALPNHYEALQLPPSASAAEIKRQFYTLSKTHHPDRNPSDPSASTRFVAISEAYHVLSVPEKRAQYDAQFSRSQSKGVRWGRGGGDHPSGSFSSASFTGSRPASGLNKKRSTFRGPPPSFYKSGGYGRHSAKRAEHAHQQYAGAAGGEEGVGQESYGGFAGFGPGQTHQGSEVPHFDDRRHKETHDNVYEHIYARRRRTRPSEAQEEFDRGGMVANFLMVSGVVAIIAMTAKIFSDEDRARRRDSK